MSLYALRGVGLVLTAFAAAMAIAAELAGAIEARSEVR
jgi:hypothetical protein